MKLHVGNRLIHGAEPRRFPEQRIVEQESKPCAARPRVRSEKYVARSQTLMANPNQRSSDGTLCHLVTQSAKQRHEYALPLFQELCYWHDGNLKDAMRVRQFLMELTL